MKKRSVNPEGPSYLRMKAEEQLKKRKDKRFIVSSESDMLKLIHELQVHQIELELQNEELTLANNMARVATEKFEELYDFAPSGYFTLSRQGIILEMNLCSARMLGKARSLLIKSRFDAFLMKDYHTVFTIFMEEIFQSRSLVNCELPLLSDNNNRLYLHLSGIISENNEQCHVTAIDITERKLFEERFKSNQEKFRVLAEVSLTGIWTTDPLGNNTYVSPQWCQITGISPEEALGSGWSKGLHPDDRELIMNDWKRLIPSGTPKTYDFRFIRPDGNIVWVLSQATVVKDDNGNIIEWIGTIVDITERKLLENALRESEERLQLALKATNDVVWDWDVANDSQRWNEAGTKVFGWTEIVEKPVNAAWWAERVHPDDQQRVNIGFYAVVKNISVNKWQDEYRFRKADDTYAEVLDRGYILRDNQGNAIRMIGAMLDISERKKAEQDLLESKIKAEESEARFRNLMESIDSVAVQGYGPDGVTQFWNKASEKLYGYTQQEAIGSNLLDLIIPSGMKDEVIKAMYEMVMSGEPIPSGELKLKHKDGFPVQVLSSHAIVKVPGHTPELFCLDVDITKRKKAEEALRLNEDMLNASQRMSKTGGWVWNPGTNTMYWTEETYRIHDITPGEIEPGSAEHIKLSTNCYPTEDRPKILAAFQLCLKKGKPYDLEFPFTSVKGRQLWIRTSAQAMIENGKIVRVIGNIIDITERKLAEIEILKSKELLTNLNKRLESIRENERADISREIHDQLGQSLTALKIDLMSLRDIIRNESKEAKLLGDMIKMVNTISRDVQRISSELRPLMLDDLGLAPTLEWYCEEYAGRTGLKLELDIEAIQTGSVEKDLALYRVAQESLTNIIRHANAGTVQVSLHRINDILILTIQDDGIGISQDKIDSYKSLGLLGMSERVKQYDGKLEILAPPNNGTIIRASIPII